MVKGSENLRSMLVLLAITFAVSSDTNICYQIGEFNNKLTYLQGRLDLFDYITEGNVSVLLHRVEVNDLKYAENVTLGMNKCQQAVDAKLTAVESKCNALEPTFSNLVTKLDALEPTVSKLVTKIDALEPTVSNLVTKIDAFTSDFSKLNAKFNALTTTLEPLFKPLTGCTTAIAYSVLNRGNGIYNIQINGNLAPFEVYCMADPKGGLPWTVVQRRVDGSVNFYRNWAEYKRGFGELEGNFFIGLDNLHWLTTQGEPQELWVKLTDPDGYTRHAYYDRFAIGSDSEQYVLKRLGEFSGDAGDSLSHHIGAKFTTKDRDNDQADRNCAKYFSGAWWYITCHQSYLCENLAEVMKIN